MTSFFLRTERTQIVPEPICYPSLYLGTKNCQPSLFITIAHFDFNLAYLVSGHIQPLYIRHQPVIEPLRLQKRSLQQTNLPLGEILELQLIYKHPLGFPALFRFPKSVFDPFRLGHEFDAYIYIIPHP
jgi:hypothetical protein